MKSSARPFVHHARRVYSKLVEAPRYSRYFATDEMIYEPTVNLALRSVLEPGDCVIDAGAHYGHLSLIMSRCVGPRGAVFALEANPSSFSILVDQMRVNGCANVQAVHAAVHSSSGKELIFEVEGAEGQGSRVVSSSSAKSVRVTSVALDDLIRSYRIQPKLIKMDIEGSELEALRGMRDYLGAHKPTLILELSIQGNGLYSNLELLLGSGYTAIDLHSFRKIRSVSDFPAGQVVKNAMFIHPETCPHWLADPQLETVLEIPAADWKFEPAARSWRSPGFKLQAGWYSVDMPIAAKTLDNQIAQQVWVNGKLHSNCHGHELQLAASYQEVPVYLPSDAEIRLEYTCVDGVLSSEFRPKASRVTRVKGAKPLRFIV